MHGGFSFCGVDIAELGLEYAPDNANTYVFRGGEYKLSEQTFDAHDGGYFYGTTVAPKTFTLRCIYQDQHVNGGILANVTRFFRRGRTGRLVFQKRPWAWYAATVVGLNVSQITNFQNGIITIQLKAYYPFARTDEMGYEESSEWADSLKANTGILPVNKMPVMEVIAFGETLTQQKTVLLYNGGTERAAVAIEIAGDVDEGVMITNPATSQSCKFVALTKAVSTNQNKYLICDGMNGKTVLTNGTTSELAYLYHDHGFIELEPAFPIHRDVRIRYTAGRALVTSIDAQFTPDMVGQYVYVSGTWRRIASYVSASHVNVTPAPTSTGEEETEIVTMNEITITPSASMSLTRLNFVYLPTFE